MSEYEALRKDIEGVAESITGYAGAATRHALASDRQIELLWADNAELRDELHALSNRVETLTRARLTEPAEVAEAMVAQPYPMCRCGHRHDHHRHHEPGKGCYRCDACRGYSPWPAEVAS